MLVIASILLASGNLRAGLATGLTSPANFML